MRTKRINYRAGLLWGAIAVLVSCTQADLQEDAPARKPQTEPASLQIGNAGLATVVSRATLNVGGEQIGIFVKEDSEYQVVSNRLFTYNKSKATWETDNAVLLRTPVATLGAYYPWKSSRTQPIPMKCRQYASTDDISAAAFTADNRNNTVNLNMKRIYSRLVVTFVKGTGVNAYHGDAIVTAFSLKGNGVNAEAFFDLFTGNQLKAPDKPIEFTGIDCQADHVTKKMMDCLIVPATLDGTLTFGATVDTKPMEGTVSATALCGNGRKLEAGKQYKLTVTVNPTGLEVSSLLVVDWDVITINDSNDPFKPEK